MVFTTCFDSHESSSGYVQNLLVLALLFVVLTVIYISSTLIKHNGMDTFKIKFSVSVINVNQLMLCTKIIVVDIKSDVLCEKIIKILSVKPGGI
jgi:hypothetical protein